jgi:katanin p60 ATPase-containing subunit A1
MDADVSLKSVAAATEGYSGSDVMLLCKEMAMRPLRRLMAQLECGSLLEYGNLAPGKRERGPAAVGPITAEDVAGGMAVTKPSAVLHLQRYISWSDQYGQTG